MIELNSIIPVLRRGARPTVGRCIVCRTTVTADDPWMHAPRGGYVHTRCATYRRRRVAATWR